MSEIIALGEKTVKPKIPKTDKSIPNWLLYAGTGLLLLLGALKIVWGLLPLYR